jgi:Fe-S-cluster containining protein
MQDPVRPLAPGTTFRFACTPRVPCFNACCRDLQQVLTPYDVLCLKRFLKLSASEFLRRYTIDATGPGTGLPVVSLRFNPDDDLACPFVTAHGCRVYPARPASCRTYPLARGLSRNRATGQLAEHWAVIREPHCRGFESRQTHTVGTWIDDQDIAEYNRFNDTLLDLITLKHRIHPGPLAPAIASRVRTALYDLDTFRREIFRNPDLPPEITASPDIARARDDDEVLLRIAMIWARFTIQETRRPR